MMTVEMTEQTKVWTWADQVSSWRFWGLLIFYLLSIPLATGSLFMELSWLRNAAVIGLSQIGMLILVGKYATGFGFCLAWVSIKWRAVVFLVILAGVQFCGLILLFYGSAPFEARLAGMILTGLATGAISLSVPAIIAGGRGGAEAFVVSFGVVTILAFIVESAAIVAVNWCLTAWGVNSLIYIAAVPVVLSAIILFSVNTGLFSEQPPDRGYTLTPLSRDPVSVALLFFVPFYALYWLYRAHGEVAAVAHSRNLLSPRGALLGAFVPFLSFVAVASLIDALNRKSQEIGGPRFHSPVTIFLWALFFAPAAGAMIQSGINRLLIQLEKNQTSLV
jgi:hypothetical protein